MPATSGYPKDPVYGPGLFGQRCNFLAFTSFDPVLFICASTCFTLLFYFFQRLAKTVGECDIGHSRVTPVLEISLCSLKIYISFRFIVVKHIAYVKPDASLVLQHLF